MADAVHIRLFGPAQVEYADHTVRDLPFGKALALLSYLAVHDRPLSREHLADLFWPDKPAARGRANLSWQLHHLSTLAPGCLEATPDAVGFRRDSARGLDLDEFTALAEERDAAALAAAAALYRGDLLEGLYLDGCADYEVWLTGERERWRRRVGWALRDLVAHHLERGEHPDALRCAQRLLALEPWQEEAHRQVMRLLALDGQRSAALRQYDECVRSLERELGLPPSEATTALYEEIRAGPPDREAPPLVPPRLQHSPPAQATRSTGHESEPIAGGQKRLITVLCADVSASFHRSAGLSPEGEEDLVERFIGVVEDELGAFGGRRARVLGGRAIIPFGLEQTHESDAEQALRAALELRRQAMQERLDVRFGVHTGEVYVQKPTPEAIAGSVVEQAIRLAETGTPGQIWVGEVTYRLTRRLFEWGSAPEGKELAYSLERSPARPRTALEIDEPRPPLIGRDEEWAKLQSALDHARQGKGQMVSLIGEAGIGKSRLIAELRSRGRSSAAGSDAEDRPREPLWLPGRCLDLGTVAPYAPFIDILAQYFAWTDRDDDAARSARIASALQALSERPSWPNGPALKRSRSAEIGALLCRLLLLQSSGARATAPKDELPAGRAPADKAPPAETPSAETPEQIRRDTFLAIRDLFLALSRQQPLVLVFDNLQWADDLSLDLISLLMESVPDAPWLLLCAYRPERAHRSTHLGRIAARKCGDAYTELVLRGLSGEQGERLMASLLYRDASPRNAEERGEASHGAALPSSLQPALRGAVLARAQGNPFFIEEALHALIDAEVVYQDAGRWRVRQGEDLEQVPKTVQSVVLSRVDRLSPVLVDVLQTASVIGSVFERRVLAHTLQQERELEGKLWALEEAALIFPERTLPQVEYRFRHDLIQATIYANLPRRRREILHGRVAAAIESLYGTNLDEVCEQIAFHYDRGESAERAIPYLLRAGLKARDNSANEAAIAHLQRGLELLRAQPEGADRDRRELELLLALGIPLVLTRGHASPEVESTYARAHALCAQGCDPADRFQAVLGLRRVHFVACELRAAQALGEELLEIADEIDDRSYLARAHMMQGEVLNLIGAFDASLEHGIKGLAATSDDRQQRAARLRYGNDTQVGCGICAAWAQWYLGYPDQAAAGVREMLALAESLSHPFTLTYALGHAVEFHQHVQDTHETLAHALRLLPLAAEHAFVLFEARGTVTYGWALVARGGTEEGLLAIKKGISALQRMGTEFGLAYCLMLEADALRRAGRVEQGLHTVERALALESTRIGRRWQADLHRLRGELIVASGAHEREAEACFRRALEIARKQGARSWELRAATSLGRLLHRQGSTKEARALVQGIYGWFSEGFDTADLREAKTLLEQWAD